jgi:hypothetical protein
MSGTLFSVQVRSDREFSLEYTAMYVPLYCVESSNFISKTEDIYFSQAAVNIMLFMLLFAIHSKYVLFFFCYSLPKKTLKLLFASHYFIC